ncbi:MAG TPA: FadR/GntR family transcriptional regulator [Candidatus Dormibacteraeota bacterium]|jgi:DNA-binding FadR family transcriptional regulator|nr:FadR/GntR family transcriptional regulator [Candidatus Dormibacteraeota bacterium]
MIGIDEDLSADGDSDSFGTSPYRPGYESIAERIVGLVTSGSYREGDRLPTEVELAKRLGVGRSIVREALKMLSAIGFVRVRRGSGIYVGREGHVLGLGGLGTVEPDQVDHLFEFRLTVEPQAAALAAGRLTVARARELRAALEINRAGAERGDVRQFGEGDSAIHLGIAEATGNRFLVATVRQTLSLQSWVVRLVLGATPGSLRRAVDEHRSLVEALESGDPEASRRAMSAHIRTSLGNYQAEMRRRLVEEVAER